MCTCRKLRWRPQTPVDQLRVSHVKVEVQLLNHTNCWYAVIIWQCPKNILSPAVRNCGGEQNFDFRWWEDPATTKMADMAPEQICLGSSVFDCGWRFRSYCNIATVHPLLDGGGPVTASVIEHDGPAAANKTSNHPAINASMST